LQTVTDVFILTGEWEDVDNRHLLKYYGRSPDLGAVELIFDNSKPLFMINRDSSLPPLLSSLRREPVQLKTFTGKDVDALYFQTHEEMRTAAEILKNNGIAVFESDVKPNERFLMERFINACATVCGPALKKGRLTTFVNPRIKSSEVEVEFKIASIDIETGVSSGQLYSIAIHLSGSGPEKSHVFMLGTDDSLSSEVFTCFRHRPLPSRRASL